jgi:hypothetical protein
MKIILKAVPLVVAGVAVVMFVRGARLRAASQVNVSTYHNDNARTGQNLNETILTTGNVNVSTFGRLFTVAADGYVYAQPLIVSNLNILGVLRDVVFVETEHDGAYAFDADSGQQLWYTSFINPSKGISTVSNNDIGCGDIVPEVGITSTPAIDTETNSIYMVAKTKENGAFFQRLHVLDITTGEEKPHSPVTIEATVPGKGDGSVGGNVRFDPLREHQRPSLLLQHGLVEIAWASHCDISPYHGWVMAFSANTYQKTAVWNSTPNGGFGGIWQGDAGLAGDSNFYIYGVTGNGTFDANTSGGRDYGNSVVKLEMSESANVGRLDDYFTPFNQSYLSENDLDLGAGGLTILPDHPGGPYAHLLVQSGKDGSIYLVNRDNMGKYNPSNNDQIVQFIPYVTGGIWGAPAWWNHSVYFGGAFDAIKQFAFNTSTGLLSTSPVSESPSAYGYPGPEPTVSANGNSNAIVWAIDASNFGNQGPEVLHAFDATNLGTELYNTAQNSRRDNPGPAVKFAVPTVANGKVFVGAEYQLSVYGLLP